MAGLGTTRRSKVGGLGTNRSGVRSTTSRIGRVQRPASRPMAQASPRQTYTPPQINTGPAGSRAAGNSYQPQPHPTQTTYKPPAQTGNTSVNLSATANPQLNALLNQQQQNIQQLQNNTSLASDVTALRTADAYAGAQNAAKYLGGEGNSGIRDTRSNQLTDASLRENARRQTDLTLGREGMITNAIQGQLPTIMGQQSGMLAQQGIGLQAAGLQQNAANQQFNQGLQGQYFNLAQAGQNQNAQQQAYQNQLAAMQYGGGYGMSGGNMAGPSAGGGVYRPAWHGTKYY